MCWRLSVSFSDRFSCANHRAVIVSCLQNKSCHHCPFPCVGHFVNIASLISNSPTWLKLNHESSIFSQTRVSLTRMCTPNSRWGKTWMFVTGKTGQLEASSLKWVWIGSSLSLHFLAQLSCHVSPRRFTFPHRRTVKTVISGKVNIND